ncbi:hypothetical protein SESBI_26568 [Sesbania bispinosa]|nr:hypothetical protein SESBI_26568 [Sesbania bispinosa]
MPPKVDVPQNLVDEKAMRRWLKKAGGDPGVQGSEGKPTSSTTKRRKKQNLDAHGDAQSKMKPGRDFNKKEDRTRVNKAGMRNVGKHLQTMGMQTAFIGYCFDSGLNSLTAAEETKKSFEVKCTEVETKYSNAITEQEKLNKDLGDVVAEKEKLTNDLAEVVAQKKQLTEEKDKSDLDIDALQKHIAL